MGELIIWFARWAHRLLARHYDCQLQIALSAPVLNGRRIGRLMVLNDFWSRRI
jgi:hypothetical protein